MSCMKLLLTGISKVRQSFIYISAIFVLISSVGRLILEVVQFIIQFPHYLKDWINWMEVTQYVCSIIFVCVFRNCCLCPLTWQWQVGVVAVFLGWIDLIVFISKFPLTGVYVLMFIKILTTFIKILILSTLLVIAFGLTFYLTFTQPEILVWWFTLIINFGCLLNLYDIDYDHDSVLLSPLLDILYLR